MTFEFNYDPESEEVHITVDNSITCRAFQQNGKIVFVNFSNIDDEDMEGLLKNLCKETFHMFT
jgi:hypothetical protein